MTFVAVEIVVEDTQNQYVTFDLEKQIADLRYLVKICLTDLTALNLHWMNDS